MLRNVVQDGDPLGFRDEEPFAANGRCLWHRCPAPLVHPAFAEAIADLALPASELEPADWELYNGCAEAMLLCCWSLLQRGHDTASRGDYHESIASSIVVALCGNLYNIAAPARHCKLRRHAGTGILP